MGDRRRDSRGRPPSLEPRPSRHPPPDMPPFHEPMGNRPSLMEPTPHHSRGLLDRQRRRESRDEGPMEHRRRPPDFDVRYPASASVPLMHGDGPMRDGGRDDRGHRGRRFMEEHDELPSETYDYRGPGGGDPRGPPRRPSEPPRRPQSTPRYGDDRDRFFESPGRGRRSYGYPEHHGGERECFDGFSDRGEIDREYYRGRDDPRHFGDGRNHVYQPDHMQHWPDDEHEWGPPPPGPRYREERGRPGGMGQGPFVPEYSSGFDEERPSCMPCQESRRSSSVPNRYQDWGPEGFREGPHDLGPPEWEDEYGSLPYHPEPPDFGGMERGPVPSEEYPGENMRDAGLGGYDERPPKSSSHGYPRPRQFQERGREMSGMPPYEDRLHHSPGSGRRPFREGFSEMQGPPRLPSNQQPPPRPMGQEESRPFQGVGSRDNGLNLDNAVFEERPMMPFKDASQFPLPNHPKGMAPEQATESCHRKVSANSVNPWPNLRTTGCSDQPGASGYGRPPLSQERPLEVPEKGMGGIPARSAPLVPPPQPPFSEIPGRSSSSVDISQQCHRTPVAASRCEGPPSARAPPGQRPLISDGSKTERARPLPGSTGEIRQLSAGPQPRKGISQKLEVPPMQPTSADQYQLRTPVAPTVTSTPQLPLSKDTPPVTANQHRQPPPAGPSIGSVSQAPQCGYIPPATADQQRQQQAVATCASDVSQVPQSTSRPSVKGEQRERPPITPCTTSVSQTTQSSQTPAAQAGLQRQRPTVTATATSVSETLLNAPGMPVKTEQQQQRSTVTASVSSVSQIAPEPAIQKSSSVPESRDDLPVTSAASHSPAEERPSGIEDRKGQRPISFPLPKGKLEQLASQVLRPNHSEKGPRAPTIGSIQSQVSTQISNEKQLSSSSDKQHRPVLQGSSGPTQSKSPTTPLTSPQLTASTLPPASTHKPISAPPLPPSQLTSQTFFPTSQLAQAPTSSPTPGSFSAPGMTEVRPPITTTYPQQFFPMTYMPVTFAQEGYMTAHQQLSNASPSGSYDFQQRQATSFETKHSTSVSSPFLKTAASQCPASVPATVPSTPTPSYFTTSQRPVATDVQVPTASPLSLRGQVHPSSTDQGQLQLPSANQQKSGEKGMPSQGEETGDAKGRQTPVCDPKPDRPAGGDVSNTIDAACKSVSKLSTSNIDKCSSDVKTVPANEDDGTREKQDAKVNSGGAAQLAKTPDVDQGVAKNDVPQKASPSKQAIQSKIQNADAEKRRPEPTSKADASSAGETKVLEDEAYPKKPVCFMMREFALKRQEASMKEQDTELKHAEKPQCPDLVAKKQKAKEPKVEGSLTEGKDMFYGPRPPTVEEISGKSKNTLAPDTASDTKISAGDKTALYDQEVSSSTPETAVAGSSKQGNDRKIDPNGMSGAPTEKAAEVESIRRDDAKPTEKIEPASSRKHDDSSDERSGHSSERSSRANDDSHRRRSSKRRRRTYSSSDGKYEDDDSDVENNNNDGVCLSGRGNEGQVFGIPVVFKAISTTRTFWNIRGGQVARELEEIVGDNVVNQKINRAGFLCVNVATAADAVKLLNLRRLGGAEVESVIPSMYLRHEAKIRGVPYHYTNEKLAELFADVGVLSARRQLTVKRMHDGTFEEFPRSSVVLTFKPDATLPKTLELDNEKFIVEEYIEAPLQCFKCLRFGHTSRACVSVSRCKNCGARYCDEECERSTPMCANCFGPHQATYVGCPRRREVAFASLWKRTFDINAL